MAFQMWIWIKTQEQTTFMHTQISLNWEVHEPFCQTSLKRFSPFLIKKQTETWKQNKKILSWSRGDVFHTLSQLHWRLLQVCRAGFEYEHTITDRKIQLKGENVSFHASFILFNEASTRLLCDDTSVLWFCAGMRMDGIFQECAESVLTCILNTVCKKYRERDFPNKVTPPPPHTIAAVEFKLFLPIFLSYSFKNMRQQNCPLKIGFMSNVKTYRLGECTICLLCSCPGISERWAHSHAVLKLTKNAGKSLSLTRQQRTLLHLEPAFNCSIHMLLTFVCRFS